jgi:hypothetical protein
MQVLTASLEEFGYTGEALGWTPAGDALDDVLVPLD